ncbi:YcnI family protein [Caenimonas sedimenti]|uniref:YcnI family protein n=1 Tax=Caenimonas sedimenti TaxID=2596921 RepID=A0A562ZMI1_9BURK|nr:YcnI family protein [Caenimonas sedimenti]TWO69713.1 YcnI family protein [Caenimonas sedimenti]
MKSIPLRRCIAALLAALSSTFAAAHVVLEYQVAPAGSSYKATFKVTHGCGASPTRQMVITMPAGVRGARPMPKPGWTIDIVREKLAQPSTSHGRTIADNVARVTWTARSRDDMLASAHYDEFVLSAQLPAEPGTLWWPVQQICEEGRADWTETPRPGQDAAELKSPAAMLEVLPAGAAAGHKH